MGIFAQSQRAGLTDGKEHSEIYWAGSNYPIVSGAAGVVHEDRNFHAEGPEEISSRIPLLRLALLTLPYHGSRITGQSDDLSMSIVCDTRRKVGHHRIHSIYSEEEIVSEQSNPDEEVLRIEMARFSIDVQIHVRGVHSDVAEFMLCG